MISRMGGQSFSEFAVVAQDGWLGVHGYLSTEPLMRAVFLAVGPAIRPGVTLETVDNSDVAPTVAQILGVTIPRASGRVLTEILQPTR